MRQELAELLPLFARNPLAATQQPIHIANGLAIFQFIFAQPGALLAQMPGMVSAGESFVGPYPPAGPAVMSSVALPFHG